MLFQTWNNAYNVFRPLLRSTYPFNIYSFEVKANLALGTMRTTLPREQEVESEMGSRNYRGRRRSSDRSIGRLRLRRRGHLRRRRRRLQRRVRADHGHAAAATAAACGPNPEVAVVVVVGGSVEIRPCDCVHRLSALPAI